MGKHEERTRGITRGELLKAAAVAAPGALLAGRIGAQPARAREPKRKPSSAATPAGMNAILFLTAVHAGGEHAGQRIPPGGMPAELRQSGLGDGGGGVPGGLQGQVAPEQAPGAQWEPSDVGRYGFARWNPPDAGANQELSEAGGGVADDDGRFMDSTGSSAEGREGALEYLGSRGRRNSRSSW